jgi:ABC-type hemin transport system substrate-binding protein
VFYRNAAGGWQLAAGRLTNMDDIIQMIGENI